MTDKWYNLDNINISKILGREVTYTCYLCNNCLNKKENKHNYFNEACYKKLCKSIVDTIGVKDICNIIISKIQ